MSRICLPQGENGRMGVQGEDAECDRGALEGPGGSERQSGECRDSRAASHMIQFKHWGWRGSSSSLPGANGAGATAPGQPLPSKASNRFYGTPARRLLSR